MCAVLPFLILASFGPSAQAQYPSSGHDWQVTYASSGTSKMHYIYGSVNNIVADSQPWADTLNETSAPHNGAAGGQYAVDASSTGSVTATLTWVPTTGQDATSDPAPKCVIVQETASASASGGNNAGGTYQADDGLGDPAQGGATSPISQGTHYSVKDGTSGTIMLPSV